MRCTDVVAAGPNAAASLVVLVDLVLEESGGETLRLLVVLGPA
jgi:hypothetical protein